MKNLFFVFIIFIPTLLFANSTEELVKKVENGRINLLDYDFEDNGILKLDGNWEFYYNKIYNPDVFFNFNKEVRLFKFPEIWNNQVLANDTLTGKAVATYRIILDLKKGESYGLKFPYQATCFKVFVDGEFAVESGKISPNIDSLIPSYKNKYYYFKAKNDKVELILQIGNNAHRKGGTWSSISIGEKEQMENSQYYSIFVEIFIAGALFILALFHFIQFFNRNNEHALLSFALFYFIVFARLITTGERVLLLGFPNLEFEVYNKIEYLSFFLAMPAFIFFIEKLFTNLISKKTQYIVIAIPSIFVLITLFSKVDFYSNLILPFQLVALVYIIFSFVLIVKAIKRKDKGANLILYGTIIVVIGVINDILFTNQVIPTIELTHYSVLIFSLFQAMAVSLNVMEIENRNHKLQAEFETSKYLSDIGKEITSTLNTKTIFTAVYQHLRQMMPVDIIRVGVFEGKSINYFFNIKEDKFVDGFTLSLRSNSIENWCVERKKEVFINNLETEFARYIPQGINREDIDPKTKAIILIPLFRSNKVVGIINIQSFEANVYTKNKLNIIESITSYAFIAYANAKSFEQIQNQKREIEEQRDISITQEKEITSSINYASKIQQAMLPAENIFDESFAEHFIFFRPRDIVSGDFYWVRKLKDLIVIVAADCTGHGVPGAFVSMLGISILNKITIDESTKAGDILNVLREEVKQSLNQTGKIHELRDGMDLSLCIINTKTMDLQFAGANNHLYIITDKKLSDTTLETYNKNDSFKVITENIKKIDKHFIIIRADRQPIGIYRKERDFSTQNFKLKKGDRVYMFSDGFVDQFGGEKGFKFRIKYFKELLVTIHNKEMKSQKEVLEKTFLNWKAERKQIDDILVMGVRI